MLIMVDGRLGIGIGRIHPGRLAFRIRVQHRIVIGDIRCRHGIFCTRDFKSRDVFHRLIEVAARHFADAQEKVVRESDLHLGAFIALGRNVFGTDIDILPRRANLFKTGDGIGKRQDFF